MRRAPSSRTRGNDALRNSVFDAAHEIGLADPNALRWLEQNANISEEDEEEEDSRGPRPPSDTHPPSLVFSTSSSEPDSSVHSPSHDHSPNYRAPYPRPSDKAQYQAYAQSQFHPHNPQPQSQLRLDTRLPAAPSSNSRSPLNGSPHLASGLRVPDPWPPSQLAIASLQPSSRSTSPGDLPNPNTKQAGEPKKTRKLTKAPRVEVEPEVVPARKVSSGGESTSSGGGRAAPVLPVLPFPSSVPRETMDSNASISGLSAVSGSSSGTVTQPKDAVSEQSSQSFSFPSTPTANERSVFEDDADDVRPGLFNTSPSTSHSHNSPSTSTATSTDVPSTQTIPKEKESKNGLLRTMRSFKLSLKGQKAPKIPLPEAPPVPVVPSLPPVLTLKLDKGASEGFVEELRAQNAKEHGSQAQDKALGKEVEQRALKTVDMFKPAGPEAENGNPTSSVYTTNSSELGARSDAGHIPSESGHSHTQAGPYSDLGHAPIRVAGGGGGFWSANVGTKKDRTNKPPKPVLARRMSIDQGVGEGAKKEKIKVIEKTRAGTVGTRNGHARKPSKSGDFTGIGWEKTKPPVPTVKPGSTSSGNPTSPQLSFGSNSRHSLERNGFGAMGEHDEMRALDVHHQLQSFVASMRGTGGENEELEEDRTGSLEGEFTRKSDDSFNFTQNGMGDLRVGPRGDDSDTLRSSGEFEVDPFRTFVSQARSTPAVPLPRPESEAVPHRVVVPAYAIPKEVGQISVPVPKRTMSPIVSRSPELRNEDGSVSVSENPSIVVGEAEDHSMGVSQHSRTGSKESELGLGYSGFGFARTAVTDNNSPSEEWVVPSPSWAPLDPRRARSPLEDNSNTPVDHQELKSSQFLDVRMDRQRASGLSIPRSVTPDSPRLISAEITSGTPLTVSGSVTPLVGSRSSAPLAPSRSVTPIGPARSMTAPLVARSVSPQPQNLQPLRGNTPSQPRQPLQVGERGSLSPPVSRRPLPARTSSISSASSGDLSLGHGSRVRSPPPRIIAPAPGPRSIPAAPMPRSATSTPVPRAPIPRSMSTTPTPRALSEEEPLRHEQFSRFLAPETIPQAQKRGRVSPFPTRPVRERSESRDRGTGATVAPSRPSWEEFEENQPSEREKYPGGAEKYGSDGLIQVPRVRFIGVRSSNGSSQAGWQGQMDDVRKEGPPVRSGSWYNYDDEQVRPASWESGLAYDDPRHSVYDEETQGYDRGMEYSARAGALRTDDPVSSEASPDTSDLRPPGSGYPGWAIDATTPASRASTFTVASVYDDEEPIPSVPNTQKLAAAVRGMGSQTWSRGRI